MASSKHCCRKYAQHRRQVEPDVLKDLQCRRSSSLQKRFHERKWREGPGHCESDTVGSSVTLQGLRIGLTCAPVHTERVCQAVRSTLGTKLKVKYKARNTEPPMTMTYASLRASTKRGTGARSRAGPASACMRVEANLARLSEDLVLAGEERWHHGAGVSDLDAGAPPRWRRGHADIHWCSYAAEESPRDTPNAQKNARTPKD